MKPPITLAERVAIVLASLALSIGLIAILSGFFAARDQPGVAAAGEGPGQRFPDLGDAHLRPGAPRPRYDSSPPTSGPHVPAAVRKDRTELSDDQLLEALALGDVVIVYGGPAPPAGLDRLVHELASPFSPALAAAGQAVIRARRPGTRGLVALAWAHMARVPSARDPLLRAFVQYWLGRGAPGA